jgi:hypothetical protein
MDYFTIKDHSYESPHSIDTFRATMIVINNRRIYADDYDDEEDIDIRIDKGVMTVEIPGGGMVRSTHWTFMYDFEMTEDDKMNYKDFTRL